jgi:hypothetical protein
MGKTVPVYHMALEEEINRWSGFARALRRSDREAFDELIYFFRSYASEISNATNPIFFELMVMSILLFQQRRISKSEAELQELKPDITIPTESQEPNIATEAKPENSDQITQWRWAITAVLIVRRTLRKPLKGKNSKEWFTQLEDIEFTLPKESNKIISPIFTENFDFNVKSENGILTFTLTPKSKVPKIDNLE